MEGDKDEQIRAHAYKLWDDEGRPEGRHEDHWSRAKQHVGMMGDGTEEQNLDQAGDPSARISEAEVAEAFGKGKTADTSK